MADNTQKLGFDASGAMSNLTALNTKLLEVTKSMAAFAAAAKSVSTASAGFAGGGTTKQLQQVNKGFKDVSQSAQRAGEVGSKAGKSMTLSWETFARVIATQLIIRSINKIIVSFKEAVESAREFGLAIAEVATISGNALGSQTALADQVLRLSSELGKPAQDVAEGLYQTLSNQVVDASESFNFLEQAMKLASVTASETKSAVNALSSVINSYGLSAADTERISNTLFKTVELGRLRLEDISDIIGRVTPLTAKMGIAWEEVAGSIAVMTRQGVRADTAVTQLRAVVQKMIKPTEKLSAVFKKWGVADGPTAIKTFGGLRGVLAKLAKEVDHNDAEMAAFFSRVRAITANMAIMTDGGKALEEAIMGIRESTNAASDAWDEFTSSQAFELTQAANKLDNELLRVGNTLTWLSTVWKDNLRFWLSVFNDVTSGLGTEWQDTQDEIVKLNEETADKIQELSKDVTQSETAALNERVQANRQALAAINVEWAKGMATIDNLGKLMNVSFKNIAKGLDAQFKSAFKNLTNFVKNAKKQIQGARDKATDLRSELAGRKFNVQLEKLTDSQKIGKLLRESTKQFNIAKADLAKATTEEQLAAADKQFDRARKLLDRADSIASGTKGTQDDTRVENAIQKQLKQQANSQDKIASRWEAIYEQARRAELELNAIATKRLGINKQIASLMGELSTALNPIDKKTLEESIKILENELSNLQFTDQHVALMESLGIDQTMAEVNVQLQKAMDDAHFDWESEVNRLGELLKDFKVQLRLEVDVPNIQAQLDASKLVLGRDQKPTEADADFINQATDAAIENQAKLSKAAKDLQATDLAADAARINSTKALLAARKEVLQVTSSMTNMGGRSTTTEDTTLKGLLDTYQGLINKLKEGELAEESVIENQARLTQEYIKSGEGTRQAESALTVLRAEVEKYAQASKNIDAQTKFIDEASLKSGVQSLLNAQTAAKGLADSSALTKTSMSSSAQSALTFSGAIRSVVGAGTAVAGEMRAIASATLRAAEAANKAAAAMRAATAAAGAAKFHGGLTTKFRGGKAQYLAQGGQGQDTVPALLSPGEFVVNSNSTKKFFSELNAINSGSKPVTRDQGGSITNVGDVNVTVQGGDSSQQTVREIGGALRREVRRGTIKLS